MTILESRLVPPHIKLGPAGWLPTNFSNVNKLTPFVIFLEVAFCTCFHVL